MKKFLALLLILAAIFIVWGGQHSIEASAKTFDQSFANTLKQGRLPTVTGKVGTSFGTIYKKKNGYVFGAESFNGYSTSNATYYYDIEKYETIYYRQKTKAIEATFIGNYTKSSIRKKLKPLAYQAEFGGYSSKSNTDLYKAGRFYAYIDKSGKNTRVIIATKQGIRYYFQISKIYE